MRMPPVQEGGKVASGGARPGAKIVRCCKQQLLERRIRVSLLPYGSSRQVRGGALFGCHKNFGSSFQACLGSVRVISWLGAAVFVVLERRN
jgi:hypothetical protein